MDQLTSFIGVNFLICFSPRSNLWVIFITYCNHSTFTHHHFAISLGDHMCLSAKSLQSCPTLSDPIDCSLPGSPVHGILQARILKCVAIPSSRRFSRPRDWTDISYVSWIGRRVLYHYRHLGSPLDGMWRWKSLSCLWLFATPWTIVCQAPLSTGFSR